ncbi:hypothetical protein ABIF95_002870 [Bradyrhizobium ottawaense]
MRGCLAYRGYGHGRGRRFCSDASLSPCRLRFRAFALRSAQSSILQRSCPRLFILGIVAGTPAAGFAALFTIPLVWWAFIPPFFEFNALSNANTDSINLFCLLAVLLIGLADLCRETMRIVSQGGLKSPGESAATNPQ